MILTEGVSLYQKWLMLDVPPDLPLLPYDGKPRASVAHNALSLLVRYRLRLVFILRDRIADSVKYEG